MTCRRRIGAKFHKGFADATAEIWNPVKEAVDAELKRKDRPLWITGHSLGGSLAMFSAWLLKRNFVPVHQIYTYRDTQLVGNAVACQAFDREFAGSIFRYVNGKDPVPKLPSLSLIANDYAHAERQMLVGPDPMTNFGRFVGNSVAEPSTDCWRGNSLIRPGSTSRLR